MNRVNMLPVAMALVSAVLWGLWWIPVRSLNDAGIGGAWAGVTVSLAACPLLFLMTLLGPGFSGISARSLAGAAFIAVAFTTYTAALDYADVVRVILLFYLAPAWSTLIEIRFLGRRWSWQCLLALSCSMLGLFLIVGGDLTVGTIGAGEMLALFSGVCWAAGAALLFAAPSASAIQSTLVSILLSVIAGTVFGYLGGSPSDGFEVIFSAAVNPSVYLIAAFVFMPMFALTLWSARKLPPALMSYLLTVEIISGIVSSVILLDENFGLREFAGSLAIVLGATIELLLPKDRPAAR